MNHLKKFERFVNEAETVQFVPKTEKKPEYWNVERELVVNAIFDQGYYKSKVGKSLLTKLMDTGNGYTFGMLEPEEKELYNKLAGKKEMDKNKRQKFWSIG